MREVWRAASEIEREAVGRSAERRRAVSESTRERTERRRRSAVRALYRLPSCPVTPNRHACCVVVPWARGERMRGGQEVSEDERTRGERTRGERM